MSQRQITPCEQIGQQVAATRWGDTSQRQIAKCVLENLCENLCLRNGILSLQQVAKNPIRLNLCDLLRRQNSVAATNIFSKFSSTHEAICRCDVSPHRVVATCRLVCTDLYGNRLDFLWKIWVFWKMVWIIFSQFLDIRNNNNNHWLVRLHPRRLELRV